MTALSAGRSDGGARLVAYDKANGDELGSVDLPRGAIGTPMTYMLDGKQYIALTVGGSPPELIALALPEVSRQALATSSVLPFEASRREASRTGDSPALAPRSVWSGVYSQAQAARGEQAFVRNCIACHSDKLGEMAGHGPAPAVIGPDFRVRWTGASIADLYDTIMQTMPAGASNSLSPGEYADLTAFLLRINEYPAGTAEINPYQRDHLMRITIDELAPSLHTPLNSN
jgi:mono/diheme cytochrome c family protein